MLGKVLKYEWKATARLFLPLYLMVLAFATINRFLLPIADAHEKFPAFYSIMTVLSMIIYVSLLVGLILMALFVMIQRFYKNLLGDEGYLMFTLPVPTWMHILSKLLISMLWVIISGIVAICSIGIVAAHDSFQKMWESLCTGWSTFQQTFGNMHYLISVEMIVMGLLSLAAAILTIYAAIALGHLFRKYKLLISFGMYIVLNTISQILMLVPLLSYPGTSITFGDAAAANVQTTIKVGDSVAANAVQINGLCLGIIACFGVISVAYFLVTHYILDRKLNLE